MNSRSSLVWLVLVASLGANAWLAWRSTRAERRAEIQFASPEEVAVIRTPGGLLQVSTIRSPETFQATTDHKFLGIDLGATTTQIRVPATFDYHIELAPEWRVTVREGDVLVIAPPIRPTLPVAINTARLEKFSSGTWSVFTGPGELDVLQRSITQTLALKAGSPSYVQFQREAARQTVQEFVAKWLLTQDRFQDTRRRAIRVFFADEPISTMSQVAPIYTGNPAR